MRAEGVLAHDTSQLEFSSAGAGYDYEYRRITKLEYDAGVQLNDISVDDTASSSFTNESRVLIPNNNQFQSFIVNKATA